MSEKIKKFVIIDAMALAYKAYFAFITHPLKTSKGESTSAVYGFVNQLIKILEDTRPDYVAVAFDSKEKTFRHEKYDFYKAERLEMPDDMIPQIQRIKEIIELLHMPVYILSKYEADDIIGTAVCKAEEQGFESYVITPDKDFIQVITDHVKLIRPGKTIDEIVIYDKQKIKEEFGFEPKQMIDYLALIGDSSDNIPGVAGIGPKTAIPVILQYGSIEGIYEHIDEIEKPALKRKLIEGRENAFISKDLATIHCFVPLEFDIEKALFRKPDFDIIRPVFIELEFKTLYTRLLKIYENGMRRDEPEEPQELLPVDLNQYDKEKSKYTLITTVEDSEKLAIKLSAVELFVFQVEIDSSPDFLNCRLAGISFSISSNEGYFIAVNPYSENLPQQTDLFTTENALEDTTPDDKVSKGIPLSQRLPIKEFRRIFTPLFADEKIKKVCQNAKHNISVLRSCSIEVNNFYFDNMLASYCIDPDQKHGMDELAQKYLHYKPIPLIDLIGKKKGASSLFDVELEALSCYSCENSDVTFRLYDILEKELKSKQVEKVAYEIEFPLIPVLEDMERTGVRVDKEMLRLLSNDLQILLDNYTRQIYDCCGEEFNINSPLQLQKILFEKLGLKTGKKTKTGYSTDAKSLEDLKGEHQVIDMIMDFRQVAKLKSTYADSLPLLINPATGRIHTSFAQTVASTGRLSSNDPNLQNIPIRSELGKEIRKAFVPRDKDHVILSADYSQIELRIMASICGDETLGAAFRNHEDIHRSTASHVFQVPLAEVNSDMRRKAKEVNFGILYGLGVFGLKTRLGVSQTHAKDIIETYFNTFKNVKNFMDESVMKARERGYAETLMGRKRYLKNINSTNRVVRQFEERVAINMPIQGSAADLIKIAMINIFHELKKLKSKTKMVLQVHDELMFDAHKDEINEIQPMIKELMEKALPLNVPVVADTGVGNNWLDAH